MVKGGMRTVDEVIRVVIVKPVHNLVGILRYTLSALVDTHELWYAPTPFLYPYT